MTAIVRPSSVTVLDLDGIPVTLTAKKMVWPEAGPRGGDEVLWAIFEADGNPDDTDDVVHFIPVLAPAGEAWKRRILGDAGGPYFYTRRAALEALQRRVAECEAETADPEPLTLDRVSRADLLAALMDWHPKGHDPEANGRALWSALVAVKEG